MIIMKKVFTLFVMLLAFVNLADAQFNEQTIGDDSHGSQQMLPTSTGSYTTFSQQIYTKEEIQAATGITSGVAILTGISFYYEDNEEVTRDFNLHLAYSPISHVSNPDDYIAEEFIELVYSGTHTFQHGWNKIVFKNLFHFQ